MIEERGFLRESIFTTLQTKFQRHIAWWQAGMLIICLVVYRAGNLSFSIFVLFMWFMLIV